MSNNTELKVAVIRQELIELTGDYRQALILNQFIYWTSRVKDYDLFLKEEHERETNTEVKFRNGWIYKTAEELSEETMLGLSPSNMRIHIKALTDKGWLQERRNPDYKWDKTLQYRVDTLKLKNDLHNLGYSINIDGEYRVSILENRVAKTENQTTQNETAIPENTTETTTEIIKNDNGVLPNGKNSANAFPNSEIVSAISKYMNDLYVEKTGKKHPYLKPEQYKRVYNNLDSFCDENAVDEDGLVAMMVAFLDSEIDSDWNINHFATDGILLNRFYEELY